MKVVVADQATQEESPCKGFNCSLALKGPGASVFMQQRTKGRTSNLPKGVKVKCPFQAHSKPNAHPSLTYTTGKEGAIMRE
jgi:hypothetical protein